MKKQLRMYVLVPYNISEIQQGIQAAHGIVEYGLKYPEGLYKEWATTHKVIIIYNGGTTGPKSTMMMHKKHLDRLHVKTAVFCEEDLNDAMTAIAFVLDMDKDSHIVGYLKQMRLA